MQSVLKGFSQLPDNGPHFSPVFFVADDSRRLAQVSSCALTNTPRILGLKPIVASRRAIRSAEANGRAMSDNKSNPEGAGRRARTVGDHSEAWQVTHRVASELEEIPCQLEFMAHSIPLLRQEYLLDEKTAFGAFLLLNNIADKVESIYDRFLALHSKEEDGVDESEMPSRAKKPGRSAPPANARAARAGKTIAGGASKKAANAK